MLILSPRSQLNAQTHGSHFLALLVRPGTTVTLFSGPQGGSSLEKVSYSSCPHYIQNWFEVLDCLLIPGQNGVNSQVQFGPGVTTRFIKSPDPWSAGVHSAEEPTCSAGITSV